MVVETQLHNIYGSLHGEQTTPHTINTLAIQMSDRMQLPAKNASNKHNATETQT